MAALVSTEDDDVLELCALVEEYKEALESMESQNAALIAHAQALQTENESLKETTQKQSETIGRLDDSVNQLMEELEQKNEALATKDSDLQSLQHCLSKFTDRVYRRSVVHVFTSAIYRCNTSPQSRG
jgi:chromosome segregation ATPase